MTPQSTHKDLETKLLKAHEALVHLAYSWQQLFERWGVILSIGSAISNLEELEQLKVQITARTPIKILLLGGSGVGKSTLINALAGEEISSASTLTRAHTSGLVIYTHQVWNQLAFSQLAPLWSNELCEVSECVEYVAEPLQNQWIIDSPDIDSTVLIHRARTQEALLEAELPIIVTSPQKYRDARCLSMLKLLDPRRPVIFVVTQLDEVWPEHREELILDLFNLSHELGLEQVQWVGLDAYQDKIHAQSEGLTFLIDYPVITQQFSFGVNALYQLITERLDEKEATRLKAGRFAQRMTESLDHWVLEERTLDEITRLLSVYHSLNQMLTTKVYRYLNLVMQRLYDLEEIAPLEILQSIRQSTSDSHRFLCRFLCLPLEWVWSWLLSETKQRLYSKTSKLNEHEALLECQALFTQALKEINQDQDASAHSRQIQKLVKTQLEAMNQELHNKIKLTQFEVPLSRERFIKESLQSIGISILLFLILSMFTSIPFYYLILTSLILFIWQTKSKFNQLQIQRGVKYRKPPELSEVIKLVAHELVLTLFDTYPKWTTLQKFAQQENIELLQAEQRLRDEVEKHQSELHKLQQHLGMIFTHKAH